MSFFTNDQFSVVLALTLAAIGLGLRPAAAAEEHYLEVWSQGHSSFEIEGSDVVATFTDGVKFEYLGVSAQSKTLQYNQADQVATASGDVVVFFKQGELAAQEMVFNGDEGLLTLRGGVSGLESQRGFTFNANEAEVHFPPGSTDFELKDMRVNLIGEITLTSDAGDMLSTRDIEYSGATGEFFSMAPFLLTAAIGKRPTGDTSSVDLSRAKIYGMELHGNYDEDAGLQSFGAQDLSIKATGEVTTTSDNSDPLSTREITLEWTVDSLNAQTIRYDEEDNFSSATILLGEIAGWIRSLSGNSESNRPEDADIIELMAQSGEAELDAEGLFTLQLHRDVRLLYAGSPVVADSLVLEREGNSYVLKMPGNVAIDFNLAEATGIEPVTSEELRAQLAQ
jgi:hypothetical protein